MFRNKQDSKKLALLLGYTFKDQNLLLRALTRTSAINENRQVREIGDFQRLEFIGDKMLNTVVAQILFKKHKNWPEGKLTEVTSKLVSNKQIAILASNLSLGDFLIMGSGEEVENKARENAKVLADAFEAIIGAIWLDSNSYDLLQSVILKQYEFFGLFDDTFDSELKEQTPITQNYTHENESSLVAPNSASCLASSTQLTTSTSPSTSVTSSQSDDGVLSISRKTLPQPGFILWGNRARTAEDKTAELVKSCIEGNMHEIYSLISDGADLNQADKSGMTPFLGAYWGLNLDVVKYLNSKEAKIVSSELAEQELIRLNKYNVIAEAKEANTPQKLYAWMCSIGKDMHGARGVIESFAAALAENATLIWNQKKNCLIAHIEEYKNIRVGYCPSESEYPKKFVLERHKECKELMLKLSVAPLITTTAQSDLKEKKQTGSKEEKKATAVIGQFFQQQLSVEEKAAALVKSCISGNLQEVQFLVAQGVNVNQPDKTGMTPLLGAYWGLNIDIIRFLSSNGLTLMISEKADQELMRLNKFDVINTFREAYSPKRLYDWMCHVDKDLYGSRGIISAYAASVAVDHKMVWDDKKKDLEASFKKINGLCFVPEVVPYNCLIIQKEKLKKLIEVFAPQVSTQKVISNSKSN